VYDQIFTLMDMIQIGATVGVCWFCYTSGRKHGIVMALNSVGIATEAPAEENVEK
jgi:hypothetical protein